MSETIEAFFFGLISGVIFGCLIALLFIAGGSVNYNGIQTIHVVDKYPTGGSFSIVTCDRVYYTSDPLVFTKIAENGTYKVKFSNNPLTHYSILTDVISGDTVPKGCN